MRPFKEYLMEISRKFDRATKPQLKDYRLYLLEPYFSDVRMHPIITTNKYHEAVKMLLHLQEVNPDKHALIYDNLRNTTYTYKDIAEMHGIQ